MARSAGSWRRVLAGGLLVFAVGALFTLAAAGSYLATHPHVGGWIGPQPAFGGLHTITGNHELIRTPNGRIHLGRPVDNPDWKGDLPVGVLLGVARFQIVHDRDGYPEPTSVHWTVSVSEISPAPDGPPAGDRRAWRAVVVEAESIDRIPYDGPAPSGVLKGDAEGTVLFPWQFVANAALRLWHAPLWLGACLGAALIAGAAATVRPVLRLRRPPGTCQVCEYDLSGLVVAICPECGTPTAAAPISDSATAG